MTLYKITINVDGKETTKTIEANSEKEACENLFKPSEEENKFDKIASKKNHDIIIAKSVFLATIEDLCKAKAEAFLMYEDDSSFKNNETYTNLFLKLSTASMVKGHLEEMWNTYKKVNEITDEEMEAIPPYKV